MVKRSSQQTQGQLKTCRNDENQINSLSKAIRPKVYITDSSSFKGLVQELTGNGRHVMYSPPPIQDLHDHVPVIGIEEHGDAEVCGLGGEGYGEIQPLVDLEDLDIPTLLPLEGFTTLEDSWMTQKVEEFEYPEVDAWPIENEPFPLYDSYSFQRLLESDPFPFYDGYSFHTEEEMLCSQYDISELYNLL